MGQSKLTAGSMLVRISLVLLAIALFSCGGGGGSIPLGGDDAAKVQNSTPASGLSEISQKYQAWLATARPGEDYDSTTVCVVYRRDGKVPQQLKQVRNQLPASRSAAAQPNALMRHDPTYEEYTDIIAASLNLEITAQVYNDYNVYAHFKVPAGADHFALAREIESRFSEFVEQATFPPVYHTDFTPNDPDFLDESEAGAWMQWAQRRMGCEAAWEYTKDQPEVLIAVLDSAFYLDHEELKNTVIDPQVEFPTYNLDIAMNDNDVSPDVPEQSHGTMCAGVVAAQGNNGRTIIGSGYGCRIVPIKVTTPENPDTTSLLSTATELAIDLAEAGANIRVISISWGGLCPRTYEGSETERNTYQRASDAGILVLAAAGNDGDSFIWNEATQAYDIPYDPALYVTYPAAYPTIFCVGAVDDPSLARASYSNWGPDVDIAGGAGLKTCNVTGPSDYTSFYGTSCATPLVAGAAALLFQWKPSLTPGDVMQMLIDSGDPTTGFTPSIPFVNVGAAINAPAPVVPSITGIELPAGNVFGPMPNKDILKANPLEPSSSVNSVLYEVIPTGATDPILSFTKGTDVALALAEQLVFAQYSNMEAELRATPISGNGSKGEPKTVAIALFPLPGDADCDGEVTMDDYTLIKQKLGLARGDAGYIVFGDTDFDGVIRENDLAAVGYFCTETYPLAPTFQSVTYDEPSGQLTVVVADGNPGETLTVTATVPTGLAVETTSKVADASNSYTVVFDWSPYGAGSILGASGDTTLVVTDGGGLSHETTATITTPGIQLEADTLYAVPLEENAVVGEPVRVVVATGPLSQPLAYVDSVSLSVETDANYVANSFNIGDVGGGAWEADGFWLAGNDYTFLEIPDDLIFGNDMGGGLEYYSLAVVPIGAEDIVGTPGALFNLEFTFSTPGTYHLGFVHDNGTIDLTYYSNSLTQRQYWFDISNNHAGLPNSIVVSEGSITHYETENNDSSAEADALPAFPFDGTQVNGNLGTGNLGGDDDGDLEDYFSFEATELSRLDLTLTFDKTTADLDLFVYDEGMNPVGSSAGSGWPEIVSCDIPLAGKYYVKCLGVSGYSEYGLEGTLTPGGSGLAPDTLYAIPVETNVNVGDPVTIQIATGQPANPLVFLTSVGFTVETVGTYVSNTFNVGVVGRARWDTDGYWALMGPPAPADGDYFNISDDLMPGIPVDIGGGFHRYTLNVTTTGPFAPPATVGDGAVLCNLQISFSAPGTYHLGFQRDDGSSDQTYYSDDGGNTYYWGHLDSSYTITVN